MFACQVRSAGHVMYTYCYYIQPYKSKTYDGNIHRHLMGFGKHAFDGSTRASYRLKQPSRIFVCLLCVISLY